MEREIEREREGERERTTDARCWIIWAERLQPRWMLHRQTTDGELESIQTASFSNDGAGQDADMVVRACFYRLVVQ